MLTDRGGVRTRTNALTGPVAQSAQAAPAWLVLLLAASAVIALGVLDYVTGPDIVVSILYMVPIAVAAWRVGRIPGLVIGGLAAMAWATADLVSRTVAYAHPLIPIWNTSSRLATFVLVVVLVSELHQRMRAQSRLAMTDGLTGLANWRSFVAEAQREVGRARRTGHAVTLASLDLDDFKTVNDSRGHAGGDDALREIAQRLQRNVRAGDLVARVGGDEFVVLLTGLDPAAAGEMLAQMARRGVDATDDLHVGLSIGAVTQLRPDGDLDALLRSADDLMYEIKRSGKGTVRHQIVS